MRHSFLARIAAITVLTGFLSFGPNALADHVASDGYGGYILPDGSHMASDGYGGYIMPDGSHVASDGYGGYIMPECLTVGT